MRCAPAGTGDVVGVGGAFDEVVKTRVPHLAKIGGMVVNPMPKL